MMMLFPFQEDRSPEAIYCASKEVSESVIKPCYLWIPWNEHPWKSPVIHPSYFSVIGCWPRLYKACFAVDSANVEPCNLSSLSYWYEPVTKYFQIDPSDPGFGDFNGETLLLYCACVWLFGNVGNSRQSLWRAKNMKSSSPNQLLANIKGLKKTWVKNTNTLWHEKPAVSRHKSSIP